MRGEITLLNLRTIFNGLNNMAIDNDGITIKIKVEYDPIDGDPINTRWEITQAEDVDVKEYIIGVLRDNDTLPSKFFDVSKRHPRYIAERKPTVYEAKTTRVQKYKKSAFYRMLDAFNLAVPYFKQEHLDILTDINQTKPLTGVVLPFLIEVDTSVSLEEAFEKQTYYSHKNRYLNKPLEINGKLYWITNHIFDRNISRIKEMLTNMVGIKYLPDEGEQEEQSEQAKSIIMNMIAMGQLPADILGDGNFTQPIEINDAKINDSNNTIIEDSED